MTIARDDPSAPSERVLLAFVGLPQQAGGYPHKDYAGLSRGPLMRARFASVAIAEDLARGEPPWVPTLILTASTEEALSDSRVWLVEAFQGLAEDAKLDLPEPTSLCVPLGMDAREIQSTAKRLQDAIPSGAEVVLDITHAYRHLPMIALAVLSVLRATSGIRIRNVRYAAIDGSAPPGSAASILDLTWAVQAAELAYASQVFAESGGGEPIARLLERLAEGAASPLRPIATSLRSHLVLLNYGLALDALESRAPEVGPEQRAWLDERSPLLAPVVQRAVDVLGELTAGGAPEEVRRKQDLRLTVPLLQQQARVVDWLLAGGRYAAALTLIREWAVNRVLLARGAAVPGQWLRWRGARQSADRALGAFVWGKAPPEGQTAELHALLSRITQERNKLDHAGHTLDRVAPPAPERLLADWSALQELAAAPDDPNWYLDATAEEAAEGPPVVLNFSGQPVSSSEGGWAARVVHHDVGLAASGLEPETLGPRVAAAVEALPEPLRTRLLAGDPGVTVALPDSAPATFHLLVHLHALTGRLPRVTYPVRRPGGLAFVRPVEPASLP